MISFQELMQLIVDRFGEDIDVVFYPDFSGHICTSKIYRKKQKDLFSWESYEDLINELLQ